jgi:hypothetical protein
MRRAFTGAFFTTQPLYQKRLAAELGNEFVTTSAGIAAKRVMSESLEEALAAVALVPRLSLDSAGTGTGGAPSPALASGGSTSGINRLLGGALPGGVFSGATAGGGVNGVNGVVGANCVNGVSGIANGVARAASGAVPIPSVTGRAPGMPTINSVGSVAGLAGSSDAEGGLLNGHEE